VEMDINTLRGISTLLMLLAFMGVCFWAYNSKRKDALNDAALIPFADDANDLPLKKTLEINAKEED